MGLAGTPVISSMQATLCCENRMNPARVKQAYKLKRL